MVNLLIMWNIRIVVVELSRDIQLRTSQRKGLCFKLLAKFGWASLFTTLNFQMFSFQACCRICEGLFAWREEDPSARKILEGG